MESKSGEELAKKRVSRLRLKQPHEYEMGFNVGYASGKAEALKLVEEWAKEQDCYNYTPELQKFLEELRK